VRGDAGQPARGFGVNSASDDQTLKVWELDTYVCRLTHRGDAPYETVAATATVIVAGDRVGGVWFLDMPPSYRSAEPSSTHEGTHHIPAASVALLSTRTRPVMTRHTILFLAANPHGTDPRALDREARAIQVEFERSGHRDRFEFVTRWATEPLDLLRELRKLRPTVVHFSGRGSHLVPSWHHADGTPGRDVVGEDRRGREEPRDGCSFRAPMPKHAGYRPRRSRTRSAPLELPSRSWCSMRATAPPRPRHCLRMSIASSARAA